MADLINHLQYLNQLIRNKDVNLVKIVTGIRRCGKSSLLDLFHRYLSEQGVPDSRIIHMNINEVRSNQAMLQKIIRFLCSNIGRITSLNSIGNVLSNEGDIQTGKKKNINSFCNSSQKTSLK